MTTPQDPELPPDVDRAIRDLASKLVERRLREQGLAPGGAALDATRPSLDPASQAAPPDPDDPGLRAVLDIHDELQIDAEWTVWARRGFTWWAHRHAQRVWSEEGVDSFGQVVYRVHVETDWGSGEAIVGRERQAALAVLMGSVSLAGAIVTGDELRWRSHAVIHEENGAWLTKLLEIAALAQATNVERGADILESLELQPTTSVHPVNGARDVPDEMLEALEGLPLRDDRPPVDDAEIDEVVGVLEQAGAEVERRGDGLSTAMPQLVGDRAMTFDLSLGERASVGAGVRMTLRLPSFPETLGVQEFPLDLNLMEVHGEPMAHLLGSWAADLPDGSKPTPFFTCFVPNATLRPGVLLNLVLSMGTRAKWIESRFG
ncbi:MAG: hypothetical protein ACRDHI_07820 [Actinomycetota bacterium]